MEKSNLLFKKFVDKYTQMKIKAEKEGNNALRTIIKLILNSLYGRFGLKYEPYSIDFVNSSKANEISINHEVFERLTIDIDKDLEYIKYTTIPSDILKEINRDEYNKLKNKTDLDAAYVVRNLTIAAMITSHASIFMNPFLNDPDNPCYYTDTDSLFVKYPLDEKYVGTELGKFSFKGKAKRAYFISPKTYCLIMEDDSVIIKSKGLNNNKLNEEHFKQLLSGHNIEIDINKMFLNIKTGSGGRKTITLTIKPEIKNRKFIKGKGLNFESEAYHLINGEYCDNLNIVKYKPKGLIIPPIIYLYYLKIVKYKPKALIITPPIISFPFYSFDTKFQILGLLNLDIIRRLRLRLRTVSKSRIIHTLACYKVLKSNKTALIRSTTFFCEAEDKNIAIAPQPPKVR
jgi:DNA polymerase type B, organellar and viral